MSDFVLLALKRIDGAHAESALQQQDIPHFAVFDDVFQIVDLGAVRCKKYSQRKKRTPSGLLYCRAVRTLGGNAPGALVRQGLMSSPPRRV